MRKCVLVTGGSRGIGEGIVRKFYAEGWDTAFCYRKREEQARALCAELPGVLAIKADVSDEAQAASLVSQTEKAFGHIDALVCSAGIAQYRLLTDVTVQEFKRHISASASGETTSYPRARNSSASTSVSYWLTLQPTVVRAMRGNKLTPNSLLYI